MDFPKSVPGVGLVAGRYVDENQATGQPGTLITAQAMNALTDEILAVMAEAGMAPDEQNNDQLRDAIKAIVGKETEGIGGLPRFTPYVWGGQAAAMPEGDTQSSGQQLTDLMYPTMRAQVTATQFTCTEAVWQADPYKRVTHWSLGDGASWMRPPDKNGVQPGNVGAFYGVGANPAGAKPGTAVIDAMRNIVGTAPVPAWAALDALKTNLFKVGPVSAINLPIQGSTNTAIAPLVLDASLALPAGTTTDPVTGEFRPRTWYGIWMIRMYGRVTNAGDLNAPALNARMDLLDARLATLEGRQKSLGDGQTWQNVTASRVPGTTYTNTTGRAIFVRLVFASSWPGSRTLYVDGAAVDTQRIDSAITSSMALLAIVPAGSTYSLIAGSTGVSMWMELR